MPLVFETILSYLQKWLSHDLMENIYYCSPQKYTNYCCFQVTKFAFRGWTTKRYEWILIRLSIGKYKRVQFTCSMKYCVVCDPRHNKPIHLPRIFEQLWKHEFFISNYKSLQFFCVDISFSQSMYLWGYLLLLLLFHAIRVLNVCFYRQAWMWDHTKWTWW